MHPIGTLGHPLICNGFNYKEISGGADGDRTRDLLTASQARSQLRHSPTETAKS